MKIEFVGPAELMADRGICYLARLDGHDILCQFSYEALEDIDPENVFGDPLEHFAKHQLKLLSIAEQKIIKGHTHGGVLQISSNDLLVD